MQLTITDYNIQLQLQLQLQIYRLQYTTTKNSTIYIFMHSRQSHSVLHICLFNCNMNAAFVQSVVCKLFVIFGVIFVEIAYDHCFSKDKKLKDIFAFSVCGVELSYSNHGEAVYVTKTEGKTYTASRDAISRYARITYAPAVQLHTKPFGLG